MLMNQKAVIKGIQKAIEAAGGLRPLGRLVGVDKDVVLNMKKRGVVLPQHCRKIHEATGVALHELNPEIYPRPAKQRREA